MELLGTQFADLAIGRIKSLINTYVDEQYKYQKTDVKAKLQQLNVGLTEIQAVIAAAQNSGIKEPNLLQWLSRLRDAIYDAEYVMDVFEYRRLEKEIECWSSPQETKVVDKGRTNKKVLDLLKLPSSSCFKLRTRATAFAKRLIFADEELNDLLEVVKKFDSLVAEMPSLNSVLQLHQTNKFRDNQQVGASTDQVEEIQETTSVPNEAQLFGRNEADEQLRKLLLQSSDDSETTFSVLSIVGVGGVGKSTLAQSVFNHKEVKDHFSMRAWVCVSTNFSIKNLMIRIIESANIEKPPDLHSHIGLDSIVAALRKGLYSTKFLIVLDDVWEDMQDKWHQIAKALNCGKQGSRIIVTSRSSKVAQAMGVQEKMQMKLNPLNTKDFWALFQKCAFGNKTPESYPKHKRIAEQIANQLGGLPLAAKTMGATLQTNFSVEHWKGILTSKMWKEGEDKIMSALKLSYDHLPVHLKKCFMYCAMFPKDFEYDEKVLLDIWIALDCVKSTDIRDKRLADIQREYIDELVSRCFLENAGYHEKIYYVIHDLLHDLAEATAGKEVYRIEDDELLSKPIPGNVRHLFIKTNSDVSMNAVWQNLAPKQLRSLVYICNDGVESKLQMPKETVEILKGLRFLYLGFAPNNEKLMLSESLGDLIHLRCIYFDVYGPWSFRRCDLLVLPESLSKLYQLQILHWPVRRESRVKLLSSIDKLINLRHVDSTGCGFDDVYSKYVDVDVDNSDMLTSYLGHLKNLEVIPDGEYRIDGNEGKDIGQLGELHKIGGSLKLLVSTKLSKEEIRKANLDRKEYIADLSIIVEEGADFDDDAIEYLQPHENLEKLQISGCRGINKPITWLSMLSNLEVLTLNELPNMQGIPADLGCLLFLQYLKLCKLPSVRQIDVVDSPGDVHELFPSLIHIEMIDMEILEGWSIPSHNSCNKTYFPKLSQVVIRNCPRFRKIGGSSNHSIPFRSQFLTYSIKLCYRKYYDVKEEMTGWMGLYVDEWPFVIEYHPAILHRLFSSLKELLIYERHNLKNLQAILQPLSNLETLYIKNCDQLESLEGNKDNTHQLPLESQGSSTNSHHFFPPSIKELRIKTCSKLKYLCTTSLQTVSSLEVLIIVDCYELKSLVNNKDDDHCAHLPPSIKRMHLQSCNKLKIPVASFQMLSSLETLRIDHCKELEKTLLLAAGKQNVAVEELGRFPLGCFGALSSVKTLVIGFQILKSLPASLQELSCLETLEIRECEQLESLEPNENTHYLSLGSSTNPHHFFPPSIKKLFIKRCSKLKFLCTTSLQTVSSLEVIRIEYCHELESLVNNKDDDDHAHLPPSIKELFIKWCRKLKIPVASFQMLSSLEMLIIWCCDELEKMLRLAGEENVPVEQLGRTLFPNVEVFDLQ